MIATSARFVMLSLARLVNKGFDAPESKKAMEEDALALTAWMGISTT